MDFSFTIHYSLFTVQRFDMCGIIGYTGKGDAITVVLEGLRRLEYRDTTPLV